MECRCLGTIMPQRLRASDEDKKKTSKLAVFFLDPSLRRDRMSRALWIRPERGKRNPLPPGLVPAAERAAIIRLLRADLHYELGASSGPPPRKRLSPAASLHTLPETVLVYALPISWPICGLHNVFVPRRLLKKYRGSYHRTRLGHAAVVEQVKISECARAGQGGRHWRGPRVPRGKIDFSTSGI
jgi:hypothetical protein